MIIHFLNDVKDATLLQQKTKTDIRWNRHMVHIREEYGEHVLILRHLFLNLY